MAAKGLVEYEDRPRGERPFDVRNARSTRHTLVAKHRFKRREIGVGAQHEDAVELDVLFRPGPIDGGTVVAARGEETTIALGAATRLLSPFFNCRSSSAARIATRAAASFFISSRLRQTI